ncbi:TetR family transcriptional regulator [Burkholderia multivorans]|uniref:TetR family transcriptional regulator n=2 Tax=Burkholderia multivorans TaxID=87883 RepID=UPI0012DCE872|nr:TetR family transcriptional regulator [Burkholderia multivorans]MBN6732545.1 TetR family transcriptional regulator [Burkholderia multivorans]MBN6734216.1 TetR family transcriptional regulator [Burkholderia multivorans]MBN7127539.1 TetR/AcrR family transcriptional regulator [Burkholderia multivorans]MBN8166362.1 TetR/AcrR family transcriptional regulator [Burkholderia multivorans]MBN8172152.1 TetR/AcrR family transcriptional regulator [Burkholderia multivorans]
MRTIIRIRGRVTPSDIDAPRDALTDTTIMTTRRRTQIAFRKQPQQARSTELVAAILQAATQVLAKEGAARFTTARVAEKAGVSVGSVYQYFPNKASILFRLQADEWMQTTRMLGDILQDTRTPPLDRLRTLVHAFLRSECDEAEVRSALNDAAPLYRDSPEARSARAEGNRMIDAFMAEVLPAVPDATRTLATDLISTTLGSVGSSFSRVRRTRPEIHAYADELADMLCAYLRALRRTRKPQA